MNWLKALLFPLLLLTLNTPLLSYAEPETNMATQNSMTQSIDINHANVEQLMQLQGIGASKAQAIISYRDLNGPFTSFDQLSHVKGISSRIINLNKDKLVAN